MDDEKCICMICSKEIFKYDAYTSDAKWWCIVCDVRLCELYAETLTEGILKKLELI